MEKPRRDVRALSLDELRRFFTSHSVPAFKGDQVYQWLWGKGSHDFLGMTNLSKSHRELLEEHFVINHIAVDQMQRSDDGTIKSYSPSRRISRRICIDSYRYTFYGCV